MKLAFSDPIARNLRKLLWAFVVLTVLMILRGVQQIQSDHHLSSLTGNHTVTQALTSAQDAATYIQIRASLESVLERSQLDNNQDLLVKRVARLNAQLNAANAQAAPLPQTRHESASDQTVVKGDALLVQIKASLDQAFRLATSEPQAALKILRDSDRNAAALSEHVAELLAANVTSINQALRDHSAMMRVQTYGFDLPLALIAIGLLIWVGKVTRGTSRNYQLITQTLNRLGEGDATISLDNSKHSAEIQDVLISLIRFRDTLIQLQRSTQELNDTNARRAALSDCNLDGLITINERGQLIDFNPAAERIFGFKRDKILGQPMADLIIPSQHRQGHHHGMNHYLKSGEGPILRTRVEITALNAQGEEFPVELTVVPFKSQEETFFLGAVRDISEKVQAEKEKDRVNKLLQDSLNDRIAKQFAIDQHAIVSMTDAQGAIRYVNDKLFQVSGYSFEELAQQDHRILKSGVHSREFFESMWATIQGGDVWSGEICNRAKDGALFWLFSTVVPMIDTEGHVYEYVAISTDITQQKQVEANLVEAKGKAEAANEAKSQFLANMSHEIRTPLNASLGMLQLLRGTELNDKQRNFLTKSESAAHFLQSLLNDVLDFSKIEANMLVIDEQAFWLQTMMEQLEDVLRPQAAEKGIAFKLRIPKLTSQLMGDEHRLRQILLNLGSNAIKFTNEGEVEISADLLSTHEQQLELQFRVRDTGIGIAQDQQERVFETFTQAEANTTRRYGGSGLGLSICRGIVRLMGSAITVDSELGKGSTFTFNLKLPSVPASTGEQSAPRSARATDPLAEALPTPIPRPSLQSAITVQRSPASSNTAPAQDASTPLRGMRVLVVEDSLPNQEVARGLLEQQGATVSVASNGQLGLEAVLVASPPYDVVLMDIQMPVMDGFVATMAIRAITQFKNLPIIAMTANTISSDRDRCASIGMNGYIGKPYDIQDVVKVLLAATHKTSPAPAPASSEKLETFGLSVATLSCAAQGGLDLARVVKRMGGNIGVYARVLSSFAQELGAACQQLARWQQEPSHDKAVRLLHSFKGTSGMLGFENLSAVFAQHENALSESNEPSLTTEAIGELHKVIEPVEQTANILIGLLQQDINRDKKKSPAMVDAQDERERFIKAIKNFMALLAQRDEAAFDMFERLEQDFARQFMGVHGLLRKALEIRDFAQAQQICDDLLLAL